MKHIMKNYLTAALVTGLLVLVIAQVVSFTEFQQTSDRRLTNASDFSGYSSMVTEKNGAVNLVWQDNRTGKAQIFYNKLVPPDRSAIYPQDLQITNSPGNATYPSMAIDSLGNIHVVWQDNRDGNWEIYYKKLDNLGNKISGDERVTNDPANSLRPTVTVDGTNNAHVSWYDDRTGNFEIYWDKRVEPDLSPINLTCDPENPPETVNVNIEATIQNLGNRNATGVDVQLLVDDASVSTQTITVNAQASQVVTFSWLSVYGKHNILIKVDPENLIAESNELNNEIGTQIAVYRITTFNNPSIWANATVKHSNPVDVTIQSVADPNIAGTPNDIGKFVDFSANTSFDQATIRIGYQHGDLGMIVEASLQMYYWDIYASTGPQWTLIEQSGVNTNQNYVWANVTHFTIFAPLGTLGTPLPPNQPTDATVWHTVSSDMNKGICGRGISYTYTTTSTQTIAGDIYYTFYWGDGTTTEVGPYASGAVASASHAWALTALGDNNVYATARIGSDTSTASPTLLVRMYRLGDSSNNGVVDNFDINPFVKALTGGKTGYYTTYPAGYYYTADCSMNQVVDNFDIGPFVQILIGG